VVGPIGGRQSGRLRIGYFSICTANCGITGNRSNCDVSRVTVNREKSAIEVDVVKFCAATATAASGSKRVMSSIVKSSWDPSSFS